MRFFYILLSLLLCETVSLAQGDADSLAIRERMLAEENNRYIRMAQQDELITASQADSLRRITSGAIEKPAQIGIDILFRIRDFIDNEYEEQMKIANNPVIEQHYFSARSMLPKTLGIPADYVSRQEREESRRALAMSQMAESMANDFEKEKLPAWQMMLHKFFPFFFGSKGWARGETTFFNGQEVPVPARR